jgi:hypothetical protein
LELYTTKWEPTTGWARPLPAWDGAGTLVMAYGGADVAGMRPALETLVSTYPSAAIVGCSTAGEIAGDAVSDNSLVVAIARFASTRIAVVNEPVPEPRLSYDVGLALGKRLSDMEPDLALAFALSDGLGVNGSPLVAGMVDGTAGDVVITGGLAGDGDRFSQTWVLVDAEPRTGYVSAVGLAGPDVRVGFGSHGGWDDFGPERRVTRAAGNVLYELDGEPALELYRKYLGERAAGLPATGLLFPLAVRRPEASERELVRTILSIDDATQSITFAGDVPEGSRVRLMRANLDRIVEGAYKAAQETLRSGESTGDVLGVAISCVGRRLVLGARTEDELEAVLAGLPPTVQLVGFYSYGEISPVVAGTCDLHNQTMTLTTLWEAQPN